MDLAKFNNLTSVERAKAAKLVRPTCSLLSSIYKSMNCPIQRLILDEVQYIKNIEGKRHAAVKALYVREYLALSGTFLSNKWVDLYGILDIFRGHPFATIRDFMHSFSTIRTTSRADQPSATQLRILQKFLMGFVIARPDSLLELGQMELHHVEFTLGSTEQEDVLLYTKRFYDSLAVENLDEDEDVTNSEKTRQAIAHATRAQQQAAHPQLMEKFRDETEQHREKEEKSREQCRWLCRLVDFCMRTERVARHTEGDTSELNPSDITQGANAEEMKRYVQLLLNFCINGVDEEFANTAIANGVIPVRAVAGSGSSTMARGDMEEKEDADDLSKILTPTRGRENRPGWLLRLRDMTETVLLSPRTTAIIDTYMHIRNEFPDVKIVIFSRFLMFLDIIDEAMYRRTHIRPYRFHGEKSQDERRSIKTQFADAPAGATILITPGAGGAGMNLACASHLIQAEVWWNGNEERQAYGRIYRKHQSKICHIWLIDGVNSVIDAAIRATRDRKTKVIMDVLAPLVHADEEPPKIPWIARHY